MSEKLSQNLSVAKEILKIKGIALSPIKMYGVAKELGLDNKLTFKGKTPEYSFSSVIYMDLKNNPNTIFEKVQDRPILIKLKEQKTVIKQQEEEQEIKKFNERDLHPLLANFINLDENFDAYVKTIYHEKSSKKTKGYDKWLYPDMVGVKFENYENETLNFISKFNKTRIKIYSFEIKKKLNVANFREYYFQAVSNSSWANEGYLVALNIDETDNELKELINKTSLSFGIGVISLDGDNLANSKIIAGAKYKEDLDLVSIDELIRKNQNFKNFIKTINDFDINNKHRFKSEFDKILNEEELDKYIKDKNIVC